MARLIEKKIKKPLAEELLFGKLSNGGLVVVQMVGGKVAFDYPEDTNVLTRLDPDKPQAKRRGKGKRKSKSKVPVMAEK